MAETVTADDGTKLDLASLPASLTYSGTQVQTITVNAWSDHEGALRDFVQTFTYTGTVITHISGFIGQ